jgi:hypothetical protein
MLRSLIAALGMQLAIVSMAHAACEGQAGNTIFEDTFADDSGGWDMSTWKVKPPEMIGVVPPQSNGSFTFNDTFNATNGDYCTEFKLPAPLAPDNQVYAGLVFLASDSNNLYMVQISSNGSVGLYKGTAGNWSVIYLVQDTQSVKTEPNSVNAIRVSVKDGKITSYVNGKQIKVIRAQIPTTPLGFGLHIQTDKKVEKEFDMSFTAYKVTSGS